jgi:hypothetical protein
LPAIKIAGSIFQGRLFIEKLAKRAVFNVKII